MFPLLTDILNYYGIPEEQHGHQSISVLGRSPFSAALYSQNSTQNMVSQCTYIRWYHLNLTVWLSLL